MEPTGFADRVAAEVRAQIARAGVTSSFVADAIGMPKATLSRRLTGKSPFDVYEIAQIAEVLAFDVAVLMQAAETVERSIAVEQLAS
jgi:transcriptional regulator with XRE-family HTH domain